MHMLLNHICWSRRSTHYSATHQLSCSKGTRYEGLVSRLPNRGVFAQTTNETNDSFLNGEKTNTRKLAWEMQKHLVIFGHQSDPR